ncbi:MAG TPA: hypothetical protein VGD24_00265 [Gallionella sp.]
MRKIIIALVIAGLCGCATNQLHFTDYTTGDQVALISKEPGPERIDAVTGVDACIKCTEGDKIVWHAANVSQGALYEGFAPIPVSDWPLFIRNALQSSGNTTSDVAYIEIQRIFLKTWHDPEYYACEVRLSVTVNGETRTGRGVIKLAGAGQKLLSTTTVRLNPIATEAIRLGLIEAYSDARNKLQSSN